jgi:flagellar biosynthesis regulator FlaF
LITSRVRRNASRDSIDAVVQTYKLWTNHITTEEIFYEDSICPANELWQPFKAFRVYFD